MQLQRCLPARAGVTDGTILPPAALCALPRLRAAALHPPKLPKVYQHADVTTQRRLASCSAVLTKKAAGSRGMTSDIDIEKEAHKVFDEVHLTVRSGNGGSGEIVEAGQGKMVPNLKYKPGGSAGKKIFLPASDPADGCDGADVVLVCDPSLDNLLHLHKRTTWSGHNGANGNPAFGSDAPKSKTAIRKKATPPLEIRVPPGTVVKKKNNAGILGELVNPGDRLVVARGGKGGAGVRAPPKDAVLRERAREAKAARESGAELIAVSDVNWKQDARGLPGQQLAIHLLLRVVADIGIVGFPNAGKSSLLKALTRASPEVAPYPFTTLMPNLGVLAAGGTSGPVLADLPGLIEGAHQGRGLGRMFLRHLRRTRAILHVVDAAAADPATDYYAVREELRLYNPAYCARPHVVALNKMDLEDASGLKEEVASDLLAAAERHRAEYPDMDISLPAALVPCSAASGEGVADLAAALQDVLYGKKRRKRAEQEAAAAVEFLTMRDRTARTAALSLGGAAAAGAATAAAGGEADSEMAAVRHEDGQREGEEAEGEGYDEAQEGEEEYEEMEEGEGEEWSDDDETLDALVDDDVDDDNDGDGVVEGGGEGDVERAEELTAEEQRLLSLSDEELLELAA